MAATSPINPTPSLALAPFQHVHVKVKEHASRIRSTAAAFYVGGPSASSAFLILLPVLLQLLEHVDKIAGIPFVMKIGKDPLPIL